MISLQTRGQYEFLLLYAREGKKSKQISGLERKLKQEQHHIPYWNVERWNCYASTLQAWCRKFFYTIRNVIQVKLSGFEQWGVSLVETRLEKRLNKIKEQYKRQFLDWFPRTPLIVIDRE